MKSRPPRTPEIIPSPQASVKSRIAEPAPPELLPPLLGRPKAALLGGAVFLLATLAVFADLIFAGGDRILSVSGTDTWGVFVGWCEFAAAEIAKGNYLPLWNPHLYSGAPCLGGFQEALLYPTHWLLALCAIPQAINFEIIIHVFLAGFFTYLWMSRRGVHPVAAGLSGIVFMFGGGYFMHIAAGHLPNLRAMPWAPLIFLAIDDITTTRSLRGAWVGSAAVAMQIFAGHPQYTYITALVAAPYALVGLWRAPSRQRAMLGLALLGIGGVALSGIQLFTGLSAAGESIRSGLRYEVASTFPFPPENLVTLVLPSFFGQISDHMYWGRWLLWEDCLFVGAVGAGLAIYAVFANDRTQRPLTILAFLLASLLVAFGKYTPLYPLLYRHLPGVNSFRGISKVAFMAALFLANLVGVGLDRLLREKKIPRLPAFLFVIAAALLTSLGALVWHWGAAGSNGAWAHLLYRIPWFAETYPDSPIASVSFFTASSHIVARDLFWCAATCVAGAAFWLLATRRRRFVYALAALAAFDLVLFAWHNRFTFPLAEVAASESVMRGELEKLPPDARVITPTPSVVLGVGGYEGWGNDPMAMRRYVQFMDINQDRPADELVQKGFTRPTRTWGIPRVFFPTIVHGRQQWAAGQPLLARAQLIEAVQVVPDPARMLQILADRNFDARRTVLLETPVPSMPASVLPAGHPPGAVEVNDLSTDEIEVKADVARPCVLLMTDAYSSAWRVVPIDDAPPQKYDILPADFAFRGIPLVSGHHHFVQQYLPRAYVVGTWVTLLSLLGWIGAGVMLTGWVKRGGGGTPGRQNAEQRG